MPLEEPKVDIMHYLYNLILFIIWPFAAFVDAIKRIRIKRYRFIIFLFFCISAIFIIPYEDGDIRLYERSIETYSQLGINAILLDLYLSLTGSGSRGFEMFIPLNSYLTSLIANDVRISFVITAALFYIFWIAIVTKLIEEYDGSIKPNNKALLLIFVFSIYIIFFRALNGRFYLAYWGAILGAYMIINEKKRLYFLLTLSTIFIHQSFIFFNAILLIHFLFQKYYKNKVGEIVLIGLIIGGAIFNQVGLKFVSENLSFLSDSVTDSFSSYTKESYIENVAEWTTEKTWFQVLRGPLLFYSTAILLMILRFTKRDFFLLDPRMKSWYYFILLFWAVNSLTFEIPQFGDRFRNVLIGFMILLLFKIYKNASLKRYNLLFYIFLLSFAFYKLVTLRVFAEYINVYAFTPLPWFFNHFDEPFSLYNLIN